MAGRLFKKSIIVTGAGSGLGRSSAIRLGEEGAHVLCVDINPDTAKETSELILSAGGASTFYQADMCSEPEIIEMVKQAVDSTGGIYGLLANAGIAGTGAAHETSLSDWNNLMDVSLTGKWLCAKHVLPHMMAQKFGNIIFQSSICALNGFPKLVAYTAAKGAIAAMTRQMATDYADYNIRVNAIAPGTIETELVRQTYKQRLDHAHSDITVDESLAQTASRYPLGRLGQEVDISNMAAFLFSEESGWMTGTVIPVDGGYTAK
ncbi:hypothetical protein IMCC14465_09600 [alpha proteobacterium IMCC14465]|uniref:Oxidoreductase n=1 Tax=alpha proteobacterium IMCC14465 TaxID=1220535 RepID=J9DZN3_9PROT|nr:hypothetical protein IMCC14465_09600 [alpha proteobacterium IMCC14465]